MTQSSQPRSFRQMFSTALVSPEEVETRSRWIETLVIPLAGIGAAWLMSPEDPLLRAAVFPWLWLGPVLVALRYGVLPGLAGGMLVLADWLVADALGVGSAADFPREFFFGGALLVMLCGEFCDVWRDRLMRIDETNLYLIERLSGLTKRHLLLNFSHDRLEQEMLARPGSLRDALVRLRATVIQSGGNTGALPGAQNLLQLLTHYVNIESAALYTVDFRDGKFVLGARVVSVGEPAPLEPDDEILGLAIETRNLAHIADSDLFLARNSNQLVVAPLVASDHSIVGVLTVTHLPFFSLNVENLQMMSVILAYYADNLRVAPMLEETGRRLPTIPPIYAEELGRLDYMQKKFGITSHIVVMIFRGPRRVDMPTEFMHIKRGVDLYWETVINGNPSIVVMMPFASVSAKNGFLERIDGWLKMRFGGSFDSLEIDVRSIGFAEGDPIESLARIIAQ